MCTLTLYSFSESKNMVKNEIVKYNSLMLHHSMESYEKHIDLIKRQMLVFFSSENAQNFRTTANYMDLPILQQEIKSWTVNSQLFIHNVVFYSKDEGRVLERGTSTTADMMFNVFYENETYGTEFWREQFDQDYNFRILPAAGFRNRAYPNLASLYEDLMPVVIKAKGNSDLLMIVFLEAGKMDEAFRKSASGEFMIRDERGQIMYRHGGESSPAAADEYRTDQRAVYVSEGEYVFQSVGKESGFTYVQRVPIERISSQSRLNTTLIGATAVSIAAAIVISWMFAAGIDRPLQRVLEAIRGEGTGTGFRSSIREFNIIRRQLQDKNKTDKQLAILQELKAIRRHSSDIQSFTLADKPFVLVLFHAISRREADVERGSFQTWLSYMLEYMENRLGKAFPDSMTFQIESNQIISFVRTDRREDILDQLARSEHVFEQDKAFGIVTIAVSGVYGPSDSIAAAYREVTESVGDRVLADRTQLITKRAEEAVAVDFDLDQWREFEANLREGNEAQLTGLIRKAFAKRQGKEVTAAAWLKFGRSVNAKIKSELSPLVIAPGQLQNMFHQAERKMQLCVTAEDLERLLLEWIAQAAQGFRSKLQLRDPITSGVLDYVNQHLSEDIYVELLADRLNLSSGYLSTYFKDKTGMNIVDYINETRIMKASTLLADNKLKIQDVSEAVGYRNITSFNRMFKKYMGLTPSEFRRRQGADA
jgi:AraC-like DNA-binding protein